jgi:hypothetical protein
LGKVVILNELNCFYYTIKFDLSKKIPIQKTDGVLTMLCQIRGVYTAMPIAIMDNNNTRATSRTFSFNFFHLLSVKILSMGK